MCGIAGYFKFAGAAKDDTDVLLRMRDAMVHRGPDDGGCYQSADKRVGLAHRRLSIVDLSAAGHQPMANEDETVWITFNGEIYNHDSLREPLLKRGHDFRSRTDTEAIIHLYEELQDECVPHLDGMFAFAIWDASRQRLLLVRDRLGKKPLYYTEVNGQLLFASEIKALLEHPDVKRDLDLEALNHFLTFADTPSPYTLFAGIRKLPAGHLLSCDREGRINIQQYWSPLDGDPWPAKVEEGECIERVRHLVRNAVAKRLMSDVPVGAFLSGGVDSSTNVALMSELTREPLRTFALGFPGFGAAENFHDLPYARRVAERFGCQHQEIMVTAEDCRSYLTEMACLQDEPIGDPACLPMHFVSKAAHDSGIKVALVGEGSDEVFGGYQTMAHACAVNAGPWRKVNRLPRLAKLAAWHGLRLRGAPAGRIDLLRRAVDGDPLYLGLEVLFHETEKPQLLQPWVREKMGASPYGLVRGFMDDVARRHPNADFLQTISYIDVSNRLAEVQLMRVDKFSMSHSLEARAPFLDHELVSYALSLPQHLKVRGRDGKWVLKEAVRPYLPAEVIDRPKQGFRAPLPEWLAGELSSWAEHQLFASALTKRNLFNNGFIENMWRRHRAGAADHSFDLWCLINLAAWYEHWIEN